MAMVELNNLCKVYKTGSDTLTALDNLNLQLEKGDIFGFIGPNGAGKTTTIKIIATLLLPSAGTVRVNGVDALKEPGRARGFIGYMPDFFGVYDDIKVWEYLDFFAAAYKIPKDRRPGIISDVLELTDLSVKKDAYVESLSRGMKQRLCLAKTLVHDPPVMLLDEPASGLDPRARIEIRELLKELQAMGKTILISSHILPEMEEFCNKIGIIERGKMIVEGDVKTLAQNVRGYQSITLTVKANAEQALHMLQQMPELVQTPSICAENHKIAEGSLQMPRGCTLQFQYIGPPEEEYAVLQALVQAGIQVRSFFTPETDLEDLFMRVTKGQVA